MISESEFVTGTDTGTATSYASQDEGTVWATVRFTYVTNEASSESVYSVHMYICDPALTWKYPKVWRSSIPFTIEF